MSRDIHDEREPQERAHDATSAQHSRCERNDPHSRSPSAGSGWSPSRGLTLPRSPQRQPVTLDRTRVHLRDTEIELLATVGAFRVVPVADIESRDGDIRSLREQGLLQTHTIVINRQPESVAVLTDKGHTLLEASRSSRVNPDQPRAARVARGGRPPARSARPVGPHDSARGPVGCHATGPARVPDVVGIQLSPRDRDVTPDQRYYAGLVKPRELAHDAQLYRMFQIERERLEAEGSTITRVVLDYELKADYHAWVHEQTQLGVTAVDARKEYAEDHDLPFRRGHIQLPDLRLEYETADRLREHRDLELATEHYSRSQLGGKQAAGFRVYRAAGAGGSRRGGTPVDPHHLEWLA